MEVLMSVVRWSGRLSRLAAIALVLTLGAAVGAPANAEDANVNSPPPAKPPTLVPVAPEEAGKLGTTTTGTEGETNVCFTRMGTITEVLDACAAFIASGSTDKDKLLVAHGHRAFGLSATKNFDGAIAEMNTAMSLAPKEPNLYFMRSAAYLGKKDLDKAEADIDEAISLKSDRGDYYMLRGMIYADRGDLDRAIAELDQKVKLDPDSTQGYSKRAELYRMKKDYDRAVADYSEVIKRESDQAKGYVDRGWIYVLKNDLDKALIDFNTALRIHTNNASALVGRGVVSSRKGKPTDGSADIQLAIKLEPDILDQIKKLGVQ
jgi:tetratricopeptide (TPR) repeat protein